MRRLRESLSRAALPAGIALAALAPLLLQWLQGRTLAWFDTQALYAPHRTLVGEALRDLRLPLWNPRVGLGMPLFAEGMHGVLHPLSLLAAWLGLEPGVDFLIGGHVSLAALGAAWLARELGLSRPAAAVAAFAYALSGFVLSMAGNLVFLAGAGALPACLAGVRRLGGRGGPLAIVAAVLGTALVAFTGDAHALAVAIPLGLVLAADAGGLLGLRRGGAAIVLGLLVGSIQLLPTAVHAPRTERLHPISPAVERQWNLEPGRVPELLLPGLLRGEDPSFDPVFADLVGPGGWVDGSTPLPFAASVFVGLLPLALAAAGLRGGRLGWTLGAAALVLLWLALGPALGAREVLRHVPVWRSFRYLEKLVGPLTLVLALLAARGAESVAVQRRAAWTALAVAATLAIAAIVAGALTADALHAPHDAAWSARLGAGAWHAAGAIALLALLASLHGRLPEPSRAPALAAAAWLAATAASPMALRPGDPALRLGAPGPALSAPPPGPRIAVPYVDLPQGWPADQDSMDALGRLSSATAAPSFNVRLGIDQLGRNTGMLPLRLGRLEALHGARWPVAARRYGLTHVLASRPRDEGQAQRLGLAVSEATRAWSRDPEVAIWETPHRPWASFPREVRTVQDASAAVGATYTADAERSPAAVVVSPEPLPSAPGRILEVARGAEWLRVEAESDGDATLVVNEAWWEGWEARIDGRPVEIHLADALVRAVRWPAGRHVLEMTYRPPEVAGGLLLTVAGLLLLGAWTWWARRRPA